MAGGGAYIGRLAGPLNYFFAPVLPFRDGVINADPAGTFKTDAITLMYVPSTAFADQHQPAGIWTRPALLTVNAEPGCPQNDGLCGFEQGMNVLIYDEIRRLRHLHHHRGPGRRRASAAQPEPAVEGVRRRDEGGAGRQPHVLPRQVGVSVDALRRRCRVRRPGGRSRRRLEFRVLRRAAASDAEEIRERSRRSVDDLRSEAEAARRSRAERRGPTARTAPSRSIQRAARFRCRGWRAWRRCADAREADAGAVDRRSLVSRRDEPESLRRRSAADSENRRHRPGRGGHFGLRGPASALFTNGGTSRSGSRWAPDQEVRFDVSSRNLNLGR